MNKLIVRELGEQDRLEFLSALSEPWEPDFVFAHYFESIAQRSFETYVKVLPKISRGLLIPSEHVPSTLLFAFNSDGKVVGRVSIRHRLTEQLQNIGGHIGYGVVPSERRKGFATEILNQSLIWVRKTLPNLNRVLVTCDDTNLGSIKTIEKNGGILENLFHSTEMQSAKRRYWINLNP